MAGIGGAGRERHRLRGAAAHRTHILGTAAGFFAFLIIPIWAFYILRDRVSLTDSFADALPHEWRDEVWAVLSIIERVIGRWIRAQLLLGLVVGLATFLGLLLLGADRPALYPVRGAARGHRRHPRAAAHHRPDPVHVPTLLVALTASDPVIAAIAVVVLYLVVQQVEGAVARAQDPGQRG